MSKERCDWCPQEEFDPRTPAWQAILNTTAPPKPVGNFLNFLSIYHVALTIIES